MTETATDPATDMNATAPADAAPTSDAAAGAPVGGADAAPDADALLDGDTALGSGEAGVPELYALTAPEGMELDPAMVDLAAPAFRALNLSNAQAQTLMPVAGAFALAVAGQRDQQIVAQVAAQRKAWLDAAKGDAEIGGHAFGTTLGLAAKALDGLGFVKGSPFRALLDDTGLGNHPEMIRAFARVGRAIAEDGFERTGTPSAAKKSDAELFYPGMTA